MRTDRVARVLGILLTVAAVPVLVRVPEPLGGMLGFALAVTGLFIAVVVAERAVPAPAADALVTGSARTLEEVSRALQLKGRPVYVPDQGNVGEERLFLPASENARPVPVLDAEAVTYAGTGDTKLGVAVTPPGLALLHRHEDATGSRVQGATVPEVEAFLQGLARVNDLAAGLRVTEEGRGRFRVRFTEAAVTPPCHADPADPLCARSGCALCQSVGCALARGLARPVTLTDADVDAPRVTLHFRFTDEPEEKETEQEAAGAP